MKGFGGGTRTSQQGPGREAQNPGGIAGGKAFENAAKPGRDKSRIYWSNRLTAENSL